MRFKSPVIPPIDQNPSASIPVILVDKYSNRPGVRYSMNEQCKCCLESFPPQTRTCLSTTYTRIPWPALLSPQQHPHSSLFPLLFAGSPQLSLLPHHEESRHKISILRNITTPPTPPNPPFPSVLPFLAVVAYLPLHCSSTQAIRSIRHHLLPQLRALFHLSLGSEQGSAYPSSIISLSFPKLTAHF